MGLLILSLINVHFVNEVEIAYRNMPKFPLLEHKGQSFCYISFDKTNHFSDIKSYFYQAAGIELIQVKSLTKPKPWIDDCTKLLKSQVNKELKYSIEIFDGSMTQLHQTSQTILLNTYVEKQKVLADLFVPYIKKEKVTLDLNHDILNKAYSAYKQSRASLSIEILNNLKNLLEQKRFQKQFSELEYQVYKNSLYQIAVYYESMAQLQKALLYYQFSLRHDLKSKEIQSAIARVLQRQRDIPKLQSLFRKIQ